MVIPSFSKILNPDQSLFQGKNTDLLINYDLYSQRIW